jgi:hypothetical protein
MNPNGRNHKYEKTELLRKLEQYSEEYPNIKITYAGLEKATDIKAHIWRDNVKNEINDFNESLEIKEQPKDEDFGLPSVQSMMEHYDNPKKIEEFLSLQQDIINVLKQYRNAGNTIGELKKEYQDKINALEAKIKELNKMLANQQDIINWMIIDSRSKKKRKEQGIKDNVIELNIDNLQAFGYMEDELFKK